MFKFLKKNKSKEVEETKNDKVEQSNVVQEGSKQIKKYESINSLLMNIVKNIDIDKLEKYIEEDNLQEAWSMISEQLDGILRSQSSRARVENGVMYFELKVTDYYEASVYYHLINVLNHNLKTDKVVFVPGYPKAQNLQISIEIKDGKNLGYKDIYLKREETNDGPYKLFVYADCDVDDQLVDFLQREVPSIIYGDINRICFISSVEVVNEKLDGMLNIEEYAKTVDEEFITIEEVLGRFYVGNLKLSEDSLIPSGAQFRFKNLDYLLCLIHDYDLRNDFRGVNYVTLIVDTNGENIDVSEIDNKIAQLHHVSGAQISRAIADKFYYEIEAYNLNEVISFVQENSDLNIKIYDNMEKEYLN